MPYFLFSSMGDILRLRLPLTIMPIAIYRHLKLTVAIPRAIRPTILNFHPRRLKALRIEPVDSGRHVTTVTFDTLSRHRQLLMRRREIWQFEDGIFTFKQERYRNDHLIHTLSSVVAPASSVAWTENGVIKPVQQQFEEEIAARSIVERYLHHHTPNPFDFMIVQLDLNPRTSPVEPKVTSWLIPPLEIVEINAKIDNSENSERWAQLFLE
jgi:hypothetical protein